ncbi:tetratricopeptide repeat protein [Geothrix campi]|uniref:tetratricopeptide repeat protein n=1 Tax=Geothrix campi TaxID=2966450 RepID=UPI002148B35F|nr:tetratricopeptide repeat protein [Geothrix sp. SG10]
MKGYISSSAGICLIDYGSEYRVINISDMSLIQNDAAIMLISMPDDWEAIICDDEKSFLENVHKKYWHHRCLINVEALLIGVSRNLRHELMIEIEDALKIDGTIEFARNNLLKLPLKSIDAFQSLIYEALSKGFGATASLLEFTRESQPLLRRIVERWLLLPDDIFLKFHAGRKGIWSKAVENGIIVSILDAKNSQSIERSWNTLTLSIDSPLERMAIIRVAKLFARQLFPEEGSGRAHLSMEREEEENCLPVEKRKWQLRKNASPYAEYTQAMKQVDAIFYAISEGKDQNARIFIQELVNRQTSIPSGDKFAVMSLCNIASHCAEMFRTDFEFECLNAAAQLVPTDGWMLIQLADHYKRVGRFEDAIETLNNAKNYGEETVAISSLADVYVQMGQYEKALSIYKSVPGGESDPTIRGAMADVLRRWGRLDEASREYDALIINGTANHRITAGQAEIAKLRGDLNKSIELYQQLLKIPGIEKAGLVVYRLGLANVLIRNGQPEEAYRLVDKVVQERPFSRQARVFRAAIAGLLGNPEQAIAELQPLGTSYAFNEWINEYVRGLLLLMLDRNLDAKAALLKSIETHLVSDEDKNIVHLGAAVFFLKHRDGMHEAQQILNKLPSTNDHFVESLKKIFNYHIAISLNDSRLQNELYQQLSEIKIPNLLDLITAINKRDWPTVRRMEIEVVLGLAA